MAMSAELILYSLMTALISSVSMCVSGTVLLMFRPKMPYPRPYNSSWQERQHSVER